MMTCCRKTMPQIRAGEYEGLEEKVQFEFSFNFLPTLLIFVILVVVGNFHH